jgi:hypothetical protein
MYVPKRYTQTEDTEDIYYTVHTDFCHPDVGRISVLVYDVHTENILLFYFVYMPGGIYSI